MKKMVMTSTEKYTDETKKEVQYTETYIRIKSNSNNWPQWRIDTHNDNFTLSLHSQKIIIKK